MIQDRLKRPAGGIGLSLGICLALASCVEYPLNPTPEIRPTRTQPTLAAITAPVSENGNRELASLTTAPPCQLRRAFVLIRTRRSGQALGILNRLLYDRSQSSRDLRSIALYLRSRVFDLRANRPRAIEDCRAAVSLTSSPTLRGWCDTDLRRFDALPKPAAKPAPRKALAKVSVLPRRQWNAGRPTTRKLDRMRGIRRLTIHHSAIRARNTRKRQIAADILAIQMHHKSRNGWGDIGYHFLIDPVGRVWQGRDIRYQGAHAGGANNEHNVGICLLGRFVAGRSGQSPSSAQIRSMERLVAQLIRQNPIKRDGIHTHKELKSDTNCPGSRLQAIVNRMRRKRAVASAGAGQDGVAGGAR